MAVDRFLRDRIREDWRERLFPKPEKVKKPRVKAIPREKTVEEKKEIYKKTVACRRNRLIKVKKALGGKCVKCGYQTNWGALVLHHQNPKDKTMPVNTSTIENHSWDIIQNEVSKCLLLCSNCHIELHNPQLLIS